MLTFYTGQVMASRHIEQKKKGSNLVTVITEVNIMFQGFDNKGDAVMQMDAIRLPEEYNDLFKASIGKYAAIPYRFIQTNGGSYMFPVDDMPPVIFDKNPIEYENPNQTINKAS